MAGRPCTICGRVNRLEIERALESEASLREVAARFGISSSSLHRHRTRHLRIAVPQPIQPALQEEHPAQSLDTPVMTPAVITPVVFSPPPPVPEPPEPDWPKGLARLSERPEPEAPAQPPVAQERPALQKYNGGRPGPCPVCQSNRRRLLEDGTFSCVECHPMRPSPGTFVHTGQAVGERRSGTTQIMASGVPSTRVPIALS